MIGLSSEPQIWKFHVVNWQTPSKNCIEVRASRATRLFFLIQPIKSLFSGIVVVLLKLAIVTCWSSSNFKKWRRQLQRQRNKSKIWLAAWGKIIVLHVQHAFWCNFLRSLPNDDVKFSFLRFWWQREPAIVNNSFFAFTWKPFVPSKRKCTPPLLFYVTTLE